MQFWQQIGLAGVFIFGYLFAQLLDVVDDDDPRI